MRAYQQDLHLVLYPDDVWLAITTQFSFYVGRHAKALRKQLVAHEGKVELVLDNAAPSPEFLDVANMARSITHIMEQHPVDGDNTVADLSDFTTTTHHDIAVASMTMMATMQKYFSYRVNTGCGFPSITLLGERDDWVKMRYRLDQLHEYGDEPTEWAALLIPIFDRFVVTFDRPDDEELKVFWETVCRVERHGSGVPSTFSGWMTAFAFWLVDGRRNYDVKITKPQLSLDGRVYSRIMRVSVPQGVAQVPVVVRDAERFIDFHTQLIAGTVGMSVVDEHESATTTQPRSGWWINTFIGNYCLESTQLCNTMKFVHRSFRLRSSRLLFRSRQSNAQMVESSAVSEMDRPPVRGLCTGAVQSTTARRLPPGDGPVLA